MFKRTIAVITVLAAMLCLGVRADAAKPTQWLIYWYVCGTDIETTRIAFSNGTNLMSDNPNALGLAEPDREPGDATRCIKEVEKATLSPDVKIFMQAGGTYIWGHEKFRDLNAKINTVLGYKTDKKTGKQFPVTVNSVPAVSVHQWFLTGGGGHTVAKPEVNGKLGRYVYDKYHRNWHAREQLPITARYGEPKTNNNETDMGSKAGLVSFLKAGQKLEQELYPDGNVRRILIMKNHGGGIGGVCSDEYTGNIIGLKEMQDAFAEVRDGWANPEEKPFELVAFDACIMSVYETAVAVEDNANYMVASQESTIGKVGLNYTDLLNSLSKNPSMSGKELGKVICDTRWEDSKIVDKNYGLSTNTVFTMSVVDLSEQKMTALKTAYENFSADSLKAAKENPEDIISTFAKFKISANASERFSIFEGRPEMVDLKNFTQNVKDNFPELKESSDELLKAIDNSVVYNKRGNGYKRGGGISVYYPLYSLDRPDYIARYQKFVKSDGLSPESPLNFYGYLFSKMQGKSVDLSDLKITTISVDEKSKTVGIELTEEEMKDVASVRYILSYCRPYLDAAGTEKFEAQFLGSSGDVKEDRKTGKFESNFNGKWVMLDGEPLTVQVVSDSTHKNKQGKKIGGNEICVSGMLINEKPYKFFFSHSYPDDKLTIIGVVPNKDDKATLPSGVLESLKKGDVVIPTYFCMNKSKEEIENLKPVEEMTPEEQKALAESLVVRGNAITIGDKPKLEMRNFRKGLYVYAFQFINPIDDKGVDTQEAAIFKIKDGKVVGVKHVYDLKDFSDLEDFEAE